MVLYCCVVGCGNNSKKASKDPNSDLSFHSFPAKPELKLKWLRAIGRPNWMPLPYSRVCSVHFNYEQINHEGYRRRILDDSFPVNFLPPNSNFEAFDVEACRICLATDVKIYTLQDTYLGTCMDSLAGAFSQNGMSFEDMPHYVCYQCVPDLIKCKKLIEKCKISQATLLDIFVLNRQITKKLIKEHEAKPLSDDPPCDENHTSPNTATESIDNDIYLKKVEDKNKNADTSLKKNKCEVEIPKVRFDNIYDDEIDMQKLEVKNKSADNHVKTNECKVPLCICKVETPKIKFDDIYDNDDDDSDGDMTKIEIKYADTHHKNNKCKEETPEVEIDEFYDDDDVEEIIIYTSPDDSNLHGDLNKGLGARNKKEKITKNMKKEQNKSQLSLKAPLDHNYMAKYNDVAVAADSYDYHDNENDSSPCTTIDSNDNTMDSYDNTMDSNDNTMDSNDNTMDSNDDAMDSNDNAMDSNDNTIYSNNAYAGRQRDHQSHLDSDDRNGDQHQIEIKNNDTLEEIVVYDVSPDDVNENGDESSKEKENVSQEITVYTNKHLKTLKDESKLMKYYKVIDLSIEEQIQEWKERTAAHSLPSETSYQCEICNKTFAMARSYRVHLSNHEPSFGRAQCQICKLRFKTIAQATLHSKRVHSKKYFCRSCPKTYNNVDVARKHLRWHLEHSLTHVCALCGLAYSTRAELEQHRVTAHVKSTQDKVVTKMYSCETCDIDFASESARQVHLLTSIKHRKKPKLWPSETAQEGADLSKCCVICDVQCTSFKELALHMKAKHSRPSRPQPKKRLRREDKSYPRDCEFCGVTLPSRLKHWQHVRWKHPKNMDSYKADINAICDICGKGSQSLASLRRHQLRHRKPTVQCDRCPRVFYDKFALSKHAFTHGNDRPHQCSTCGRAFNHFSNFIRHHRVHTDITPYECSICGNKFKYSTSVNLHIRTVHNKEPQPPRKKRSKPVKNATDTENIK